MCQFKSAICLKDRVYVPDHDHHGDMLSDLGIDDDYLHASKTFVRVELSPSDGDKTSDVYGWKLKVDQDITPDWWDESVYLPRLKQAVKEWCDKHILREGTHEVKEGIWYASDSATVYAYDSATVYASGSATVILPKCFQTSKPVQLSGEAICINHLTRKISSPISWEVEVE